MERDMKNRIKKYAKDITTLEALLLDIEERVMRRKALVESILKRLKYMQKPQS
jgi:t-SNARE complex subunit (syntaxin)